MAVSLSVFIIGFAIFLRCSVNLYGYSGEGKPPMFGDYEAQRHWMEVTFNLPVKEWYSNSTHNDLQYWGLDYPPLTAYHSFVCGLIANYINPDYVRLHTSRGYESAEHKHFMRMTVLFADIVVYFSAAYLFVNYAKKKCTDLIINMNRDIELLVLLTYPGLILIDHGHFQYNCISLGLCLFSFLALMRRYDIPCAILYCLAVSYKQMSLYYSLALLSFYLGKCKLEYTKNGLKPGLSYLIRMGVTVIITIVLVWLPFVFSFKDFRQVLNRIFPIQRGVFEDKVSNVWCVINVICKFRLFMTNEKIAVMCGTCTLLASLPACYDIFTNPIKIKFLFSLINCSLSFFLFSYQVHEKSILLVSLPILLTFRQEPLHCFWFILVSTFSMLPLILKDNLLIPYIGLIIFFCIALFAICITKELKTRTKNYYVYSPYFLCVSLFVMFVLTLFYLSIQPPKRYPDLFPLIISTFSAIHFCYFLIYFTLLQFDLDWKVKFD